MTAASTDHYLADSKADGKVVLMVEPKVRLKAVPKVGKMVVSKAVQMAASKVYQSAETKDLTKAVMMVDLKVASKVD